jgi:hypothetical protein
MEVQETDFQRVSKDLGISPEVSFVLWERLTAVTATKESKPTFDFVHLLYYFGALIVMGAFGWFMTSAWDAFGAKGLLCIASCYAAAFLAAGAALWKRSLQTPGGLLITLAVCMTPLICYSIESLVGLWPAENPGSFTNYHPIINGSWVIMEIATVITGLIALRYWSFPFISAPIAHAIWFLSMDAAALLFGESYQEWDEKLVISAAFGAVMLLVAYLIDLRNLKADFAFWLYLFGTLALSSSLSMMNSGNEFHALLYAILHFALMLSSIALKRRTLMVFGALGVFGYLGHLSHYLFKDSILFPFALCSLGIGLIVMGIWYQKNRKLIESNLANGPLRQLESWIPMRAR